MSPAERLAGVRERMDECVHCGICLPTCPTYAELGTETDSPRGRIWLIRAVAERRAKPTETLLGHLDSCLDCRACETACPSGVRYGEIIEGARAALAPERRHRPGTRVLRRMGLSLLLPSRARLGAAARLLAGLQTSGIRTFLARAPFLPSRVREVGRLIPRVKSPPFSTGSPRWIPARPPVRGRVALFTGCVMDAAMSDLHRVTVEVLVENGFEVAVPREQTCCGAVHVHQGDRETARKLARENLRAFDPDAVDRILVNSAGCGAELKEYARLFPEDPALEKRAHRLATRVEDVSVFLAREGLRATPRRARCRAVYDEPCHLLHAQGVSAEPRALLAQVPGLELLPLPETDFCCGSAGIYNLTEPTMSRRLLERKIDRVAATGADLLVTANPGCLLQLTAGVEARGLPIRVAHLVELLRP